MIVASGGRRHEVRREAAGPRMFRVHVDGAVVSIALTEAVPPLYRLRVGDREEVVYCIEDGGAIHLFWHGRAYRLERERSARSTTPVAGALESPMPGRVQAVKVKVGDVVVKGQALVVVEAMKMENVVRAPRDGRVQAVAVEPEARVAAGQVLVELE